MFSNKIELQKNTMKKTLLLFVLFFGLFATAQTSKNDNITKTVGGIPNYELIRTKLNLKDVVVSADTPPEFPGGFAAFNKSFVEAIPTLDIKQNKKLNTHIYFVVEKDGYVRNITAIGSNKKHNEAAELGIKRITKRWKPALIDGQPVRYLFNFPLVPKKF